MQSGSRSRWCCRAFWARRALPRFRNRSPCLKARSISPYRNNLPTGAISNTTLANATVSGTGETTWVNGTLNRALLVPSNNVIAVEIHQDSLSSSDVSFDFELTADEMAAITALDRGEAGLTDSDVFGH